MSSSDSGSASAGTAVFCGIAVRAAWEIVGSVGFEDGVVWLLDSIGTSAVCFGCSIGVSSIVECIPVVHGGMAKNSSNVKTRGLQHFQPECLVSRLSLQATCELWGGVCSHLSALHEI